MACMRSQHQAVRVTCSCMFLGCCGVARHPRGLAGPPREDIPDAPTTAARAWICMCVWQTCAAKLRVARSARACAAGGRPQFLDFLSPENIRPGHAHGPRTRAPRSDTSPPKKCAHAYGASLWHVNSTRVSHMPLRLEIGGRASCTTVFHLREALLGFYFA